MIRIAVIGVGGFAWYHLQRLWTMQHKYRLVAVTHHPTWDARGEEQCQERGIPVFEYIDDMLESMQGRCDVILVPTPIHTHGEIAKNSCLSDT